MSALVADPVEALAGGMRGAAGRTEYSRSGAGHVAIMVGTMGAGSSPAQSPYHQPALVHAVLAYLAPRPGAVIVDATCGTGGHSLAILPHLAPGGRLVALDRDAEALAISTQRLTEWQSTVVLRHGNFRELSHILQDLGIRHVDGVLVDLGMSSVQVDQPERGFSFLKEGPLDMRMDPRQATTAATLVNEWSADELGEVFRTLGEERFAPRIARRIVLERRRHPLTTTTQLAQLIVRVVPGRAAHGRLHPATRTFQALRMAVNEELLALQELLKALPQVLAENGRAVILSFHSLEDRLVKRAFAQGAAEDWWVPLTKKPVRPTKDEVSCNPRIRSVKLRAIEKR